MTYQIPQQLEYKEKIIFNLTMKQLAYALLFGGPAALIIKIKLSAATGSIAAVLLVIAGLFMFWDLETKIKDFWMFHKFQEAFLLTKQMDDFLGVEGVEDGIITVYKED